MTRPVNLKPGKESIPKLKPIPCAIQTSRTFGALACLLLTATTLFAVHAAAAEPGDDYFTMDRAIEDALSANIGVRISAEDTLAAESTRKSQRAAFLPALSASYQYKRNDEERSSPVIGVITPQDEYSFRATLTQPLFTGMALLNQYKISELGLNQAQFQEAIKRQDVVLSAKNFYLNLLKSQKLLEVAQQSVTLLEALRVVAENFYQVGMTPLNDLLKAEVELANARQDLVVAENNHDIAVSNFNLLLRRPISAPVQPQDLSGYTPFAKSMDDCRKEADQNRLELQVADLDLSIKNKQVALTEKDYYPSVNLLGNYYRLGDDWDVNGGPGFESEFNQPEFWDIQVVANWTFWEWGRTRYGAEEKKRRVSQSRLQKIQLQDQITFEIKQAYLKSKEAEKIVATVEKAVEQAQESYRISEERYKEQMATSTDVLDAQTLLNRTRTNYYNSLYDFEISKASLERAMGLPLQKIEGLP
jgi:outer membrane protein